ncbi:CpXC motif protein [Thermosporothrix hazakensis]|jgi:hypothetical protein|uniref:CpXC motif protein n=2 Tax=Thermosporothrix TaxID=768650 RepID=A0A326UBS8_THEHA|nr:CpXC domain-containing protein [Thermosporothrix hazakensis]PZW25625.1 CpXC motif protein [Thermosporothrix hazakensis]BBH89920.1 hypothetical protein KTC_46710 [Thermosporothrix sp. COM3]GCE48120.1 hypothetical protein KTH_29890 [Thermosporothrix hazakensis]
MSRYTTQSFTCPCGEVFTAPIYEYVNVEKDPQLRYTVLAGLLNVSTCPQCGRRAALARPFIYSDPERQLLIYYHPRTDLPEDARLLILEKLRETYEHVEMQREMQTEEQKQQKQEVATDELPPLQVVFGHEQLVLVINSMLSPEERLGKIALSTQSRNEAERGQFHTIARKLATEMGCGVEIEDMPDEYIVWLYGSRRKIGALMRELTPGG